MKPTIVKNLLPCKHTRHKKIHPRAVYLNSTTPHASCFLEGLLVAK